MMDALIYYGEGEDVETYAELVDCIIFPVVPDVVDSVVFDYYPKTGDVIEVSGRIIRRGWFCSLEEKDKPGVFSLVVFVSTGES
jgi:hypothetical protein